MSIVGGISLSISQHNGGSPSMEQLGASDSESPKLDIYYREAIGDLERKLVNFVVESTAQFDLQAAGDDYTLNLNVAESWPKRMQGLLSNKLQDYLVHSITAGWLNDFDGISVKQDYQQMAVQDLEGIRYIVELKSFAFTEHARQGESDKADEESTSSAQARTADAEKADNEVAVNAEARNTDEEKADNETAVEAEARAIDGSKETNETSITAQQRTADGDKADNDHSTTAEIRTADAAKDVNGNAVKAGLRSAETDKGVNNKAATAGERHNKDDTGINDGSGIADAGGRHEDDSTVDTRHPWTDWSGTRFCFPFRRFKRFEPSQCNGIHNHNRDEETKINNKRYGKQKANFIDV